MNDIYIYVIVALLPLSACLVVFQVNPYHALVIRGILGAIAALVYTVLGAADVALTEALVGTLLSITLYAVAVRSSLVMRLGVIANESSAAADNHLFQQLIDDLRTILGKRSMRLELVAYSNIQALHRALMDKEVHATCIRSKHGDLDSTLFRKENLPYHTATRVKRIYEIVEAELPSSGTTLAFINTDLEEQH